LHDIEVEDQAEALLRYANGALGYLYASTTEPQHLEKLELVGTRGSLVYHDGQLECLAFGADLRAFSRESREVWGRPALCETTPAIAPIPENRLQGLVMANFARHILFGEPLRCDAASARMSLELANAITLSSYLKAPVQLPVNRPAYDDLLARLRAASRPVKTVRAVLRVPDPRLV
jgi:predicted dehydrogenase